MHVVRLAIIFFGPVNSISAFSTFMMSRSYFSNVRILLVTLKLKFHALHFSLGACVFNEYREGFTTDNELFISPQKFVLLCRFSKLVLLSSQFENWILKFSLRHSHAISLQPQAGILRATATVIPAPYIFPLICLC